MIRTVDELADTNSRGSVPFEDLMETYDVATDVWVLYLIVEALDDQWAQKVLRNHVARALRGLVRAKLYRECRRQAMSVWSWNYKTLCTLYYCTPRNLDQGDELTRHISRRLRVIEWVTIWLLTLSPLKLAHMAADDGPFRGWGASSWAARKLNFLLRFCPWCCAPIVGPARKMPIR